VISHNDSIGINEHNRKSDITTKKDFSEIINAYNFFKEHSTEYKANWNQVSLKLKQGNLIKPSISILDFGGGDGTFLCDLYSKTDLNKHNPKLFFYELLESYKETAKLKLTSSGYNNLVFLEKIDNTLDAAFDLIFINHVLYYVESIEKTIFQLYSKLNQDGQTWILMADENNSLIKLWKTFFEIIGMNVPYFLINDLRFVLDKHAIVYSEIKEINSEFIFKNNQKNRMYITNFLLGSYSQQVSDNTVQEILSCYEKGDNVCLPLSDSLFTAKK